MHAIDTVMYLSGVPLELLNITLPLTSLPVFQLSSFKAITGISLLNIVPEETLFTHIHVFIMFLYKACHTITKQCHSPCLE